MSAWLFYGSLLSYALGVWWQIQAPVSEPTMLWWLLLATALAFLWRYHTPTRYHRYVLLVSICLLGLSVGALRVWWVETNQPISPLSDFVATKTTITGMVVREPDVRARTTQLVVESGQTLVLVRADRYAELAYGDVITAHGTLEQPEAFITDLGRSFNYPGYLQAQGISFILAFAEVEVLERNQGSWLMSYLLNFKHSFMDRLEELIPDPYVGLGEGLLLGVQQALGNELETAFRKTGIIHIVVLSGYNVMLVVAFVLYVFAFFMGFRTRIVCGLVAITLFALLVGLSATVMRASIMAGLLLLAQASGKTYLVLRGLVLAGAVMLVFNPYLIAYDVGFQLSFLATLGLIVVAPYVERWFALVPTKFGIREFLTATVATQLFISPLLLYQIGEFSVVSVIVNVLVLPMVPVAMLLTFVTGMLALVSNIVATPFAYLAYASLAYIIVLAEFFGSLPFASYIVPAFPGFIVPLCYLVFGLVYWRYRHLFTQFGYGEMAERLVVATAKDTTLSQYATWQMEDEEVLRARLAERTTKEKADVIVATPTQSSDTPIFFR
jgi:competence protein ComEC